MIKRILALLVLFGVLGGGTWYLIRNTPEKDIERLRQKILKLINSDDPKEWEEVTTEEERAGKDLSQLQERVSLARKASGAILELVPSQVDILELRAQIELRAGNPEDALQWYDRIASMRSPVASISLKRARILRALGRVNAAKQALVGAIDVYPFEVNLGIGQIQLEIFQPGDALPYFMRARDLAASDEKNLRDALEGYADALNLMLAMNLTPPRQSAGGVAASTTSKEDRDKFLSETRLQRDDALTQAINLWKKNKPQSRAEFIQMHLRIASLYRRMNNPAKIEAAINYLAEELKSEEDYRWAPIFISAGSLCLMLAHDPATPAEKRPGFLAAGMKNFSTALAGEKARWDRDAPSVMGWQLPKYYSTEDFPALLLREVCQVLLEYPEEWRFLGSVKPGGQVDELAIRDRLQASLKNNRLSDDVVSELKVAIGFAHLKSGDADAFRKEIEDVLKSIDSNDSKSAITLQLAEQCVHLQPHRTPEIFWLLGKGVLSQRENKVEIAEETNFRNLLAAVRILQEAKNAKLRELALGDAAADAEAAKKISAEIDQLTSQIHAILIGIADNAKQPSLVLLSSRLIATLVDPQESMQILLKGRDRFADAESITYSLAMSYLARARQLDRAAAADGLPKEEGSPSGPEAEIPAEKPAGDPGAQAGDSGGAQPAGGPQDSWHYYGLALREFLHLFRSRPHQEDILRRLFQIGRKYKATPDAPPLGMHEIVLEMYPKVPPNDAEALGDVLESFIRQEFDQAVRKAPSPEKVPGVRPFLNLIVGRCYLEERNRIIASSRDFNPELSSNDKQPDRQSQFSELNRLARQEFEQAVKIDPDYLPARLNLARLELTAAQEDENIPETLLGSIRSLVDTNKDNAQAHYLLAQALKMNRDYYMTQPDKRNRAYQLLNEERHVLRKALQCNSQYIEAYIALAETYILGGLKGSSESDDNSDDTARASFKPDFKKAMTVLSNAPQVPEVCDRIAIILRMNREAEKSLAQYHLLFRMEPSEANLTKLIVGYVAAGRYNEGRKFLQDLAEGSIKTSDWISTKSYHLAIIASGEANSPRTTTLQRQALEKEQVTLYRIVVDRARERTVEAPPSVVNNLAYRLSMMGDDAHLDEALQLLEPVVEKIKAGKIPQHIAKLEELQETLAWIHFKARRYDRAEELYRPLCAGNPPGIFSLHFAEVLNVQKKLDQALASIEKALAANLDPESQEQAKRLKHDIDQAIQARMEKEVRFNR